MDIGGIEPLARIEIPVGQRMYLGSADIKGCFYECRPPPWLGRYFVLEGDFCELFRRRGLTTQADGSPL
eukprot:5232944-Alexandrium_andersonii.AAC.1